MATYIGLDLGGTNIKISVFDDFFHKLGRHCGIRVDC